MRLLFHLGGANGQLLAFAGERPAARQAVEQVHAQRLFQLGDAARNRRVLYLQAARRLGQAAGTRQRQEYPDIVPVEFHRFNFARKLCEFC